MTAIDATHAMTAASPPAATKVPWRRALVRTLLYGRNVDRAAKTKARLGLAILVFALGYTVIAGRLLMFVAVPDGHMGRRTIAQDAVSVTLTYEDGARFVFPAADTVLLPIVHASAEELATYVLGCLRDGLSAHAVRGLTHIEVGVSEAPGQAAYCRAAF